MGWRFIPRDMLRHNDFSPLLRSLPSERLEQIKGIERCLIEENDKLNFGPAALMCSGILGSFSLRLSTNAFASFAAVDLYASRSLHNFAGFNSSDGTLGQVFGMFTPKMGSRSYSTLLSAPEMAASTMARVYFSLILGTSPALPPHHPVFTRKTWAPVSSNL